VPDRNLPGTRTLTQRGRTSDASWTRAPIPPAQTPPAQVPLPGQPAPPGFQPFHGTTLRFYDPALGAWRSTWIEPYKGLVIRFIGRPDGNGIRLEALDSDPPVRWSFRDVTPDSFRWTAEYTRDGGRSWILAEEMRLRRR
jgi:hypothetical protein